MTNPRAAEKRIAALLAENGCIASDPDEDVHGWDLFVEFSRPPYHGPAEDRPPVPKAYLQVKSTERASHRASIKLSNVQIATTSHDPWIIVRAYPNRQYRIVHIWGEVLLQWIKAVRKASLAGKKLHLEKQTLRFDGPLLNENQLVSAITSAISEVGERYEVEKKKLIDQFRHRDGVGTGFFTLSASSQHDLAMMLLGVDRSVPAKDIYFIRQKFGIADNEPIALPSDALITIEPKPIASCQVRFTNDDGVCFLTTFGEVRSFKLPNAPLAQTYFRFTAPTVEIVKRPDGSIYSKLGADKKAELSFAMLEQWATIGMELEKGKVQISVAEKGPNPFLKTTIRKNKETGPAYRALTMLVQLMRSSGNGGSKYTTEDVEKALPELFLLSQILSKGSMRAEFDFDEGYKNFDRAAYWFDIKIGADVYYGFIDHEVKSQQRDAERHTLYLALSEFPEIFVHKGALTYERAEIEATFADLYDDARTNAEVVSFGNIMEMLKSQSAPA